MTAQYRISHVSWPGLRFNGNKAVRNNNNNMALLLNRKYPKNLGREKTKGSGINECRKPKLVKAKLGICRAGRGAGPSELGMAGGLASVQNVCSSDFYPNSTLLKYSWPLLSELIS